jgi:hypothetical protein
MNPFLELHLAGLDPSGTPIFRIEPIGPDAGETVTLDMPEFLSLSRMLDEAAKEPHPNWHDVRQGILRSFYDAGRKPV